MLAVDHPDIRLGLYRDTIDWNFTHGHPAKAKYLLANLALEKLVIAANNGIEPDTQSLEDVAHRLDHAARANDGIDQLTSLRARLLKAWMLPIIWSDIVNLDGLTDHQAKNVAENIKLAEAADATAKLTEDALEQLSEVSTTPPSERSKKLTSRIWGLSGFINEATPLLLGTRHNTAKQYALPSLAFDDAVNPDLSMHIDGFYYDNRQNRPSGHRLPYQVASSSIGHSHISRSIVEINARQMGNLQKSVRWPNDDRPFATTRRLVTERRGKRLSQSAKSTLDSISSSVFNAIMHD